MTDWRSGRTGRTSWRGRARRAALAVVVGLLSAVAVASPASAHAALVGTSPDADALLQNAPTQVVLTFTEPVSPISGKIRVIAPDGSRVDRDEARVSGDQVIIPLREVTQRGTYLVTFRVISADSHPIGGAFPFSYLEVSPGGPPSAEGVGSSGIALATLPVARWIGYVGLVLLVGSALVLSLLWPWRLDRTAPLRTGYVGAGLLALGTALSLVLQVPNVAGGGLEDITSADVREVLGSQYGAAHLIRFGVVAAAVVLLRAIAHGRGWNGDRVLLAVLGGIAVATWSVSGHATATAVPSVSVAADMVHLASMSVWLGGLIMLVLFLLPRANAFELSAIVPIWSRWAAYAISALLLTGVAQSLVEIGTLDGLVSTSYGQMIMVKVGLVGIVLIVAAFSRRTVATFAAAGPYAGQDGREPGGDGSPGAEPSADATSGDGARRDEVPSAGVHGVGVHGVGVPTEDGSSEDVPAGGGVPAGDAPGPMSEGGAESLSDQGRLAGVARVLRRRVFVEAVVALAIIGLTSVLVQLTPARTEAGTGVPTTGVQTLVLDEQSGRFRLTADLVPARTGINELHLYATTTDGQPVTIVEWRVRASNADAGIADLDAVVTPITPDHARGQITLPVAGTWQFVFTLRLDETTNGIVAGQLSVRE